MKWAPEKLLLWLDDARTDATETYLQQWFKSLHPREQKVFPITKLTEVTESRVVCLVGWFVILVSYDKETSFHEVN